MTEEVKAHLFEPFFTTKEVGKGTGLGLATVYGIINQSGGAIRVDSVPGQGSSFRIYFPSVEERPVLPAPDAITNPSATTQGVVLLVEDQSEVRKVVRRVLQLQGFTVLEASEGREALQLSNDRSGPIDLLVTDVIMPHMSGRELADQLTVLRPTMKVLFLSGYTDDAMIRHGVLEGDRAFLQKPFTPEALAEKVREVLGL
jgi:CheY-like chemotaxis protein